MEKRKCSGWRTLRDWWEFATDTPSTSLIPTKSACWSRREIGSCPQTTELLPAMGDVEGSHWREATGSWGNNWTSALEGQQCNRLKWEQDLCFLEIPASALLLPSFLKYNFPSYKYLSRAKESHKTARSWWQRYFGHSNPLFLFWQKPSWAPSLTSSELTYSVINRES